MYCKCGNTVHPVRLELGYKNCVSCSTTKTYSYVPIITHKTGNTIQIVSQEVPHQYIKHGDVNNMKQIRKEIMYLYLTLK